MNKTKRALAWLLSFVMLLSFVGCDELPEKTVDNYPPSISTPSDNTQNNQDAQNNEVHVHVEDIVAAVAATCTSEGLTEGKRCSECNEVLEKQRVTPRIEHSLVDDPAISATCTSTGLTKGTHCSVCRETIVEQIPIAKLEHNPVNDLYAKATCTEDGLSEGQHCSLCGEVLKRQEPIAALGHSEIVDPAEAATCTTDGLTEGIHCSTCNKVLVKQETIPAKGHTEVTDPAVAATTTSSGLTEGKHCSACQAVIVPQSVVPVITASVGTGIATPVDPSSLPSYSGTPYVIVNDNIPNFSADELSSDAYEYYSDLDAYGRCVVAIATCGTEIMPEKDEERGSIGSIYPTGWVQKSYSGVSGGYLWNRCHLIGWQLSAENANCKNLITGTRYMNTEGMLPFENMVADYIKETGNHVAYRVTPIFEGSNLVCSGVQLEAYSIEDNGDGICFNVYCYNVQPGIIIDYATGDSTAAQGENEGSGSDDEEINTQPSEPEHPGQDEETVWIPKSGTKYHSKSSCSNMKNPTKITKADAESRGYEPCKKCY